MTSFSSEFENQRVLIIDDNPAIHEDFRKVLMGSSDSEREVDAAAAMLFGSSPGMVESKRFELGFACSGQEGLDAVRKARDQSAPFAVAFVDIRMPNGWDGIETVARIWEIDSEIQIVLCSAYSDYSWEEMMSRLGVSERLLILKKPFDNIEVLQLAHALTNKWEMARQARRTMDQLNRMVEERTAELHATNARLRAEIAERTQVQEALRLSEQRFSRVFSANPLPMLLIRASDAAAVDVNQAFVDFNGQEREAVLGNSPTALGLTIEGYESLTDVPQLAAGERLVSHPSFIRDHAGEDRASLLWLEPVELLDGPHFLVIIHDISLQRTLEERLRHSEKMEAITQLSAGIAHDFNNILTIIQVHATLQLEEQVLATETSEAMTEISTAAGRAATLVNQLLAFSRKQPIRARQVDLCQLLGSMETMLGRVLSAAIDLRFEVPAALPQVWADPSSVEQIILTLAVNARDAMPQGGRLAVSATAVDVNAERASRSRDAREGRFVRLEVKDTGAGIDADLQEKIFEPFFTTKDVGKGSGMGLASVYGLVKQHEGWVEVESAPGEGATFWIYLPIRDTATTRRVVAPSTTTGGTSSGRTVLLVEDDPALRRLVQHALGRCELNVISAADGHEALRVWQESRDQIDLVLTDVVMPGGLSGKDVADRIHADRPEMKVIYASGYSRDLLPMDLECEEGVNFLAKPYVMRTLADTVCRALAPQEN
ncbi:MAG: response regulator [Chthoniobacteraceae bacterium]